MRGALRGGGQVGGCVDVSRWRVSGREWDEVVAYLRAVGSVVQVKQRVAATAFPGAG
jgi:hypothetical protein